MPLLVLRRAHVFVVPPTLVFTDYEGREDFRDAVADSPLLHLASHSITPLCSEAKAQGRGGCIHNEDVVYSRVLYTYRRDS